MTSQKFNSGCNSNKQIGCMACVPKHTHRERNCKRKPAALLFLLTLDAFLPSPACSISPPGKGKATAATQANKRTKKQTIPMCSFFYWWASHRTQISRLSIPVRQDYYCELSSSQISIFLGWKTIVLISLDWTANVGSWHASCLEWVKIWLGAIAFSSMK